MSRVSRIVVCVAVGLVLTGCDRGSNEEGDPLARGLQAHVDGDLDAAVEAYSEALDANPEDKLALYNLALVQQSQGNNVEAEGNYRRTLQVDPEYTPAMFNLAILRSAEGDHEEAVELYEQVVELEDDNAGAYLNLGFALQELGREDEAADAFDTAVELDPAMEERITGDS